MPDPIKAPRYLEQAEDPNETLAFWALIVFAVVFFLVAGTL